MERDWVTVWWIFALGVWLFSAFCWVGPVFGGPNWVTDRDLLTMFLVYMCNTIVFVMAVSLRASAHRCTRKTNTEAGKSTSANDFLEEWDQTPPLSLGQEPEEQATEITWQENVVQKLEGIWSSLAALVGRLGRSNNTDDSFHGSVDSPGSDAAGSTSPYGRGDNTMEADVDAVDDDQFDLGKITMEAMNLVNIVRQADELVFVHCGSDAYLYMKYQKYMINMIWVMFVTSVCILGPSQYNANQKQLMEGVSEEETTFYAWANAGNLPEFEKGERMYAHLFATFFYSMLVIVWLNEYRKLMVKLTDPTFAMELNSKAQDVQRWGDDTTSANALHEELVFKEAQSRTLLAKHVPCKLSSFEINRVFEEAIPSALLACHVPTRSGPDRWSNLLAKIPCCRNQDDKGDGSGTVFLTFRTRGQARDVLEYFKNLRSKKAKKQSLELDLGMAGTFGFNLGIDLPDFVQDTVTNVTDINRHMDLVLDEFGANVERLEGVSRSLLCLHRCCGRRRRQLGIGATSSIDIGNSSSIYDPSMPSETEQPDSQIYDPPMPSETEMPDSQEPDTQSMQRNNRRRDAADPADLQQFAAVCADGVSALEMPGDGPPSATPWSSFSADIAGDSEDSDLRLMLPRGFKGNKWKVQWAPEPRDINWPNLTIGNWHRRVRLVVGHLILILVFGTIAKYYHEYQVNTQAKIFFVDGIRNISGVSATETYESGLNGKTYQLGKLVYGMVYIYAPVLLLCLVNYGVLPVLCVITSSFEGKRKKSSVQKAILRKNFVFMMINILILPTLNMRTADQLLNQMNTAENTMALDKPYQWEVGQCQNACRCYGASSFHVCDPTDRLVVSLENKIHKITDKTPDESYYPCDDPRGGRQPCIKDAEGNYTSNCYNASTDRYRNIQIYWDKLYPKRDDSTAPLYNGKINGCSRTTTDFFGEKGGPDYRKLYPVCRDSRIYCHTVTMSCAGSCDLDDYLKIVGNFVVGAQAPFMYCFVVSASLLGTGWQLMNVAFYLFCAVKALLDNLEKRSGDGVDGGDVGDSQNNDMEFWDIIAGDTGNSVKTTMKENGFAFELGYYYAVGIVIFAIVIFYSVHFFPITFAGLLYFNCKHFVDKYNMLYVYPVDEASGHTRSGGQMAGTVHDMILFTLCLMQLGMASFFYIKEPDHFSAAWTLYLFMGTSAWLVVSVRRQSPINADIKYGDENRDVIDSATEAAVEAAAEQTEYASAMERARQQVTRKDIARAYLPPKDKGDQSWATRGISQVLQS